MKTKEKDFQKKIIELCELMGDNDRFLIFRNSGNKVDIALPSMEGDLNDEHISASLASVIEAYLLGKTEDDGVHRLSEIIIDAIEALIGVSPVASAILTQRFSKAALWEMRMSIDKLCEESDDVEDVSACDDCKLVKTCNGKDAIKYRKAHGIPKPKKTKKGGRKVDVN